jgi:hypothetical protein
VSAASSTIRRTPDPSKPLCPATLPLPPRSSRSAPS